MIVDQTEVDLVLRLAINLSSKKAEESFSSRGSEDEEYIRYSALEEALEKCMQQSREEMKNELRNIVASIVDDIDDDYEKLLEWATSHRDLKIVWCDTFLDGKNEIRKLEEFAHWGFSWKHGYIGFDNVKKEEEVKARKATAIFIYLWAFGIPADKAGKFAESYVQCF